MRERPILFSGPMVRAIRADIKTHTRRVVKKFHFTKGNEDLNLSFSGLVPSEVSPGFWRLSSRGAGTCWEERAAAICPHGKPGDRLRVRETFSMEIEFYGSKPPHSDGRPILTHVPKDELDEEPTWRQLHYRATDPQPDLACLHKKCEGGPCQSPWKPSIHMPLWGCREVLGLTGISMERLLSISHDDAIAEGLTRLSKDGGKTFKFGIPDRDGWPGTDDDGWAWEDWDVDPRKAYLRLWDKINGPGASRLNPWVWAEAFRRLERAS